MASSSTVDPSYYQSGAVQNIMQKEHRLHLYMFQHVEGSAAANQKIIVNPGLPNLFGVAVANDWIVRDGPEDGANVVAHARGMHLGDGMADENWLFHHSIIFTDARFKGSSLKMLGDFSVGKDGKGNDGEWAITGGTGEFAFAQGVVTVKIDPKYNVLPGRRTYELRIRAFCLSITPEVAKNGPWGGNGGTAFDIPEPPRSLQSVTVRYSNNAIISFAYSYTDQAGQIKTAGPWGGDAGGVTATITLDAPEVLKQVQGTVSTVGGVILVTSLTLVTNATTYPPFGKENGTPFSSQVPDDKSITGFYARAGSLLDALGVYYA